MHGQQRMSGDVALQLALPMSRSPGFLASIYVDLPCGCASPAVFAPDVQGAGRARRSAS